jgi:adenylate cyclase
LCKPLRTGRLKASQNASGVGTLKGLTERRAILDRLIAEHGGRIANTAGDSVLAEFGSAVEAVQCAVDAQAALAEANASLAPDRRISFRIGVHIGDVMVRAGDLFGDGVNIAARLQTLAAPGTVCISGATYDQVRKVLPMTFVELGAQQVKNIQEPIRTYQVNAPGEARGTPARVVEAESPPPLPEKPSIAVLPFQNMSGDPEQEYFADGMVEEITTALCRFHWLFVIARTSTFAYKGRAVDVKQVSRELGVRYLLEGSVRKSGNRVRITGQLVEATTGAHLWADRFEGPLENIFDLQDQVASGVVGAIDPKVLEAEVARVKRKAPSDFSAYDHFLRASDLIYRWTNESNEEALRLLYRALELDPEYAQAFAWICYSFVWRWTTGSLAVAEYGEARRVARKAINFGRDDGFSLAWGGFALAVFGETIAEVKEGASIIDQALWLNSNLARTWNLSGWVRIMLGQPDLAIEHLERAMRLSPLDFAFHTMEAATAHAHLAAGRRNEAVMWAERSVRRQPNNLEALGALALGSAIAGDLDKAKAAMKRLLQLAPRRRISNSFTPSTPPEQRARIEAILRKLGMPE